MKLASSVLNLVVIRSGDLDWAEQFYGALGLHFERHRHGAGPLHLAAVTGGGGLVFEIYPLKNPEQSTHFVRLGFRVEDVDGCVQRLMTLGARVVSEAKESEWGRRAVVEDGDGHKVELVEPLSN
ncbi:VOC family protein [Roseibacillus persicicus]|uniref:VOC domain-containing protein n=1 Tax=Roseibacillus persicicus TaxID=454148 RepID=A0A918TBS5_9BACT|nr:VOC family protein [Roseibacillus persicicus]GHC40903.1 hypothetical protein GCM10007100_01860 [Roseibacillus persicicus]